MYRLDDHIACAVAGITGALKINLAFLINAVEIEWHTHQKILSASRNSFKH